MNTDYDVIVAGAGIAGMVTAASTARHSHGNLRILVIDRNLRAEAGKKTSTGWVCGDAFSKNSLDYLEREVGVKYGKPELEKEVRGVVAYSPDHESKAMFDGPGYVLNRKLLPQRQLKDAEKLGVEFLFDTYAEALLTNDGSVTGVHCRSANDNSTSNKTSKIIVDATGSASRLRTGLPIKSHIEKEIDKENDMESTGRYIINFEAARKDSTFFNPDYCIIHLDQDLAPGGYAWVFPKGEDKMNVGLGVQKRLLERRNRKLGRKDTLQSLINEYIRSNPVIKTWKPSETIEDKGNEKGSWQVPVRRQNDCMVANGYMIVGDAAWMPRPIDAGGIGPAIYASTIAGRVVAEALEARDTSEQGLWKFNAEYVKAYGYKMASFEILRRFLQILSNDDLNYGMKHFLGQDDVDSITRREHPEFNKVSLGNPARIVWALPRLALARGLRYTAKKSMTLIEQYMNYPNSPSGFEGWHSKFMAELREAYARFS